MNIVKKNLSDMSPRIQRMMIKQGKYLVIADTLSRVVQKSPTLDSAITDDVATHVNMIMPILSATDKHLEKIVIETQQDPALQKVIHLMNLGATVLSIMPIEMNCHA